MINISNPIAAKQDIEKKEADDSLNINGFATYKKQVQF